MKGGWLTWLQGGRYGEEEENNRLAPSCDQKAWARPGAHHPRGLLEALFIVIINTV